MTDETLIFVADERRNLAWLAQRSFEPLLENWLC